MTAKPTYAELEQRVKETESALQEGDYRNKTKQRRAENAEQISFETLFNLEDIQKLQDEFAEATGVASVITHTDGKLITRPSRFCGLCNDIIRKTKRGRANCYHATSVVGRLTAKGPLVQPCEKTGLWEAGAKISVGGQHIANWLIGQVRDENLTDEKIRTYALEIEADTSEMVAAFHLVPTMSREQFERIARVLFTLANQLSETAYRNLQQARIIMEYKRLEEALRGSESTLESVFDAVPVGICFMKDRVYQRVNKNWCDSFGYPESLLIGKAPDFLYESLEEFERVGRELYGNLEKAGTASVQTRLKRSDGEIRDVILIAKPLNIKDLAAGNVVVVHDITDRIRAEEDRKRLENQFHQSQKMEAIGTLAGGIAHDFNNLLMGIQGRISMMLMDHDASHPDAESLREVERYVASAAGLTKQLLGFSKGGKYEIKPTNLNDLVKMESRMFGRTKKEITIHEHYDENLWVVEVDRGQIQQVLLNIYVNAWQAMPKGGHLYVSTRNVEYDEKSVEPRQVSPGRYVQICITDTGTGMDEEILQRIFDPFFTTKDLGRGTGLGLASAYGIIKNHGGFIDAYSERGRGSTFNIYLPASGKAVRLEKKPLKKSVQGSGIILVVDDEKIITETLQDILGRLGYEVLLAGGGKEALEVYAANRNRIDLVILDMVMPDMGGAQTYENLKTLNPHVKVLLSSGYSIRGQASEILSRGANGFIQKPFKLVELSEKVRKILGDK